MLNKPLLKKLSLRCNKNAANYFKLSPGKLMQG